mmetsp:Transcript_15417/g.42597  ORF Transcript_15417/g.42597 Transcript_15417/m.42597 type:complete len:259 (-) Transcript_15417:156-932(-)
MRTSYALVVALAVAGAATALAQSPPQAPTNYKTNLNTTLVFWGSSQVLNTQQVSAHVTNASLTVTPPPLGNPNPYELTAIDPKTGECYHAKYNPNSQANTCVYSCAAGKPCAPNTKCDCGSASGLFGVLPMTLPIGTCVGGGTLFSVTIPTSGGALAVHYCFSGTSPVYMLEQFTPSGTQAAGPTAFDESREVHAAMAMSGALPVASGPAAKAHASSHAERVQGQPQIREVMMLFKTFDITITPPSVFYPPKFCTKCD